MQIAERIRPPDYRPRKGEGKARLMAKQSTNPVIQKRVDKALREYRNQLMKNGGKGPSIYYGSDRFRNSKGYNQAMGTFLSIVEWLAEQRYIMDSQIPFDKLIADWFEAIFSYYRFKYNRNPMPPQCSPTNNVVMIFNIWTRDWQKNFGRLIDYWAQKPDRPYEERLEQAKKHRTDQVNNMRNFGPMWKSDAYVLEYLRGEYGDHIKSIDDYIENGGRLDEKGRRRPTDWV